jgi:hypothetical protein
MTVEAIKGLIEGLPPEDQTVPAPWMSERDSRAWDEQIERDFSSGGAGMALLDEIDARIDAGDIEGFQVIRPRE